MKNAIVIEHDDLERVIEKVIQSFLLTHKLVAEKPMTKTDVGKFLSCSVRTVDKLIAAGVIKPHRMLDGGDPRFLPSEILEELRRR